MATSETTDVCAMCHRTHSAASGDTFTGFDDVQRSSLAVGTSPASVGDTELCFSCHGVGSLGSTADVQTDALKRSAHVLAPNTSPYGPSPKDCSNCHDAHGWARNDLDEPYPALLRAREGTSSVYSGDRYCDTCHKNRPNDLWPGMTVWQKTAHADVTATASGTKIVCSVCHAPHGSDNRALVTEMLTPPSAPATIAVTGDDRSLCYGCHSTASAAYRGTAVYESSGHGSSVTTIPVSAEWAGRLPAGSADTARRVGECQVCHASMGADDGTGAPIPKLLKAQGPELCYRCHGAGSTISTDVESEYATAGAPVLEVVASYAAALTAPQFGVTQVYTRETTAAVTLSSPRQAAETSVGATAAGDIDDDGEDEVLVARPGTARVTVSQLSELSGLVAQDATLMSAASFIAVGDVLDSGSVTDPKNEIITADSSTVRVYRWKNPGFEYLAAVPVVAPISGLDVGDVVGAAGVESTDVVVTTHGAAATDDRLYVLTRNGLDLQVTGNYQLAGRGPQHPSVGDFISGGKLEIAVSFNDQNSDPLKIYSGAGTLLTQSGQTSASRPAQSVILADVLPAVAGMEAALVVSSPTDGARLDLFTQSGGVLALTPQSYTLPDHSNAGDVAAGDVDGDGARELLVSMAGSYAERVPAAFAVFNANAAGTALDAATARVYPAGGVERADSTAAGSWVVVADLGDLGRSRHAVDVAANSHVSTETAPFTRHVACVDCHNTHASSRAVAGAPAAFGQIAGVSGVSFPGLARTATIENEYELCFKCHAGTNSGERRDIAAEVDPVNASYHAITAPSTRSSVPPETFVGSTGLDNGSVLYCTSCHGNSDPVSAVGPHASSESPLLKRPYVGLAADDTSALCFACHRYDVYYTGSAEATITLGSRFWNTKGTHDLHALHGLNGGSKETGMGCQGCHVAHGSSEAHMVRTDIGFAHSSAGGGTCTNECHKDMIYDGR